MSIAPQLQVPSGLNGTKVKYISPDYIFTDDENNRKQFKEEIEMLGLKINPSI